MKLGVEAAKSIDDERCISDQCTNHTVGVSEFLETTAIGVDGEIALVLWNSC